MNNPLSGAWTAFNNDPKYSVLRHAVIAGLSGLCILVLQALSQISFKPIVDVIIATVSGAAIRWLSNYSVNG